MSRPFRALAHVPLAAAALLAAGPALANEFGQQQSYRFADPNERSTRLNGAALIGQAEAGGFRAIYNTSIERQINCNLSIASTGNAAQPSHSGSGIAPAGILNSGIDATTTGNQGNTSSGDQTGGQTGSTGVSGSGAAAFNGGGGAVINQGNSHSSLGATVSGSALNGSTGAINAQGAQIRNDVNTSQSNAGSTISANANNSSACSWGGFGP